MLTRQFKMYNTCRNLCNFYMKNVVFSSKFNHNNIIIRNNANDTSKRIAIIKELSIHLDLNTELCESIIDSNKHILNYHIQKIQSVLKLCATYSISVQLINRDMWLLNTDLLMRKLATLSKMHFVDMNDGLPFLSLEEKSLVRVYNHIKNEALQIPHGNRLYYLSEKLQIEPRKLANQLPKRIFIYTIPFETLQKNLQLLLDYNINSEYVVNDLWVLRYNPELTKQRLELFHKCGRLNMKPWVVKCTNKVLERSIDITVETKRLLGENETNMNYLANRLQCPAYTINEMSYKIPAIVNVRVSKIESVVDFFFAEGYTASNIIYVPRVLSHSLKTLKKRLEILKSVFGIKPKSLNILCLSKRQFEFYISTLERQNSKIDKKLLEQSMDSLKSGKLNN
ncbi:mitochondrial transcription termination factor [Arctopsyche grandis]|uniref:mitochondrial transcription termination factor n=1 Tax=Arctopsyche grandis TaxID=121162 RepID=UPI00406D91BD